MKTLLIVACLLISRSTLTAATMSDVVGSYRVVVQQSNKSSSPAHDVMFLRADSTFLWSSDTTGLHPDSQAIRGRWTLTDMSELRLVPDSTSPLQEIRIFAMTSADEFVWRFIEMDHKKMRIHQMEMSLKLFRRRTMEAPPSTPTNQREKK